MKLNSLVDPKKRELVREAIRKKDASLLVKKKPGQDEKKEPSKNEKPLEKENQQDQGGSKNRPNWLRTDEGKKPKPDNPFKSMLPLLADHTKCCRPSEPWELVKDLFFHIKKNDVAMVTVDLSHGANSNAEDLVEGTPLIASVKQKNMQIVELLVSKFKAEVNMKDGESRTALMYAAREGWNDGVTFLVSRGADLDAMDSAGLTARRWAKQSNHPDTSELLHKLGAK